MRLKGKVREIQHPTTGVVRWSPYPLSRKEAELEDVAKYWPMEPCPIHGGEPVHYTRTGLAACCAQYDAVEAYNAAAAAGEPINPGEAHIQGVSHYWVPQENSACGHVGKRTLDGNCFECKSKRGSSPRQLAIAAGEVWYMPRENDPCPNGHVARRRTMSGSCEECEKKLRVRPDKEPNLRKTNPDMVIDWVQAKTLGFKMYRTGEPCSRGHRDWRYVSTRNCLACMGR